MLRSFNQNVFLTKMFSSPPTPRYGLIIYPFNYFHGNADFYFLQVYLLYDVLLYDVLLYDVLLYDVLLYIILYYQRQKS